MKKRYVTMVCLIMTCILILAGCGSGKLSETAEANTISGKSGTTGQANASDEVVEIVFWYSWTDKIQENNIYLSNKFNETIGKELGIHVTPEYQGTYDDLHQKLQAAYVAGQTPDIAVMEIASIRTFAENGVIIDLDDYVEKANVDMSDFNTGLMDNSYIDQKLYGLPYLRSTPILYLNENLLEAAGLNIAGPKTWDELETYSRTIKDKTGQYGFSLNLDIWYIEAFMFQQGISPLNENETATNINTDEVKEVITHIKAMKNEGIIRVTAAADSDKKSADIMNQTAAMWLNSTGSLGNTLVVAEDAGFKVNTTYIPSRVTYGVPTGGCNLVISSKVDQAHQDAAFEFLNWITSTEQTAYSSEYTGYMPSRLSAIESEEVQNLYTEYPQFKVAVSQLEYGNGRPMNPGYIESMKVVTTAFEAIILNDEDMDATLTEAEEKINVLLTE